MKVSTNPADTFRPRTIAATGRTLSYYNESCGDVLWEVITAWHQKGCPRTAWSVLDVAGEREGTLKARLYNSLRWLVECGTAEQRRVCGMLTFTRIDNEFVLTVKRRRATDALKNAVKVDPNAPSPRHLDTNRKHAEFSEIRDAIFKFITESTYDGTTAFRPVLEITGVHIDATAAEDIQSLVDQAGDFKCSVTVGLNGAVRIIQFSPAEVAAKNSVTDSNK